MVTKEKSWNTNAVKYRVGQKVCFGFCINILWKILNEPFSQPSIKTNEDRQGFPCVQWLRVHLSMQGTQVWSLVQEDVTCPRVTRPVCCNYWACALQPSSHNYWCLWGYSLSSATMRSPCTATRESPFTAKNKVFLKMHCKHFNFLIKTVNIKKFTWNHIIPLIFSHRIFHLLCSSSSPGCVLCNILVSTVVSIGENLLPIRLEFNWSHISSGNQWSGASILQTSILPFLTSINTLISTCDCSCNTVKEVSTDRKSVV